jgi:PHS family inorganic phosphate transporter-like MFS transporter
LGNFSVQYNIQSATLAVAILVSKEQGLPLAPEPSWAEYLLKGDVFIGASIGMFVMGMLGDHLGRQRALIITHLCTTVGALGSLFGSLSIRPGGRDDDLSVEVVYLNMAVCRALLGFGVGGVYPLSATCAAETGTTSQESINHAAYVFIWQAIGSTGPYVVGFACASLPLNVLWRVIMGLGAVPAAACMYLAIGTPESESFVNARSRSGGCCDGLKDMLRNDLGRFTGTGGAWFLFDIVYYGTALFTPTLLKAIFGSGLHIRWLCALNAFVLFFQVPGQMLTGWALARRSLKEVQIGGFLLFAGAFAIYAAVVHWGGKAIQFAALVLMLLVLGFGPNVTTYVYPTQCYETRVRSSAHGLSSAAGKAGAIAGTIVFPAIMAVGKLEHVAMVQIVVSLLGAAVSYGFLPRLGTTECNASTNSELLQAA